MKSVVLILILIAGGLFYVRSQQPALWNKALAKVGMQTSFLAATDATASTPATVSPTETITPTALDPVRTEVITPDSTYMTSDHVRQVVQPVQPGAAPQPGTATTTPAPTASPSQ